MFLLAFPLLALVLRGLQGREALDLTGENIPEAIWLTLGTTAISTMVTLLLGTPLAYIFARWSFPLKGLVSTLVELPVVMPPAVAGLALLVAFGRRGLLGGPLSDLGISLAFSTAAVVIAQTFVSMPLYIRAAEIGFQNVPNDLEEAARVDGADGWGVFRHVTLALAWRALLAGLVLSWARAIGEFGATILFAGSLPGRTQTMTLLVYSTFERDLNAAIWVGLILIGLALLALGMARSLGNRAEPDLLGRGLFYRLYVFDGRLRRNNMSNHKNP